MVPVILIVLVLAIAELEGFIASHSFDNLVICGDFNVVDFSRGGFRVHSLNTFMNQHSLACTDLDSDISYTYRRDDHANFSWPDHIPTLMHHAHMITGVGACDGVDNFSDHLPLFFTLVFDWPLPSSITLKKSKI